MQLRFLLDIQTFTEMVEKHFYIPGNFTLTKESLELDSDWWQIIRSEVVAVGVDSRARSSSDGTAPLRQWNSLLNFTRAEKVLPEVVPHSRIKIHLVRAFPRCQAKDGRPAADGEDEKRFLRRVFLAAWLYVF